MSTKQPRGKKGSRNLGNLAPSATSDLTQYLDHVAHLDMPVAMKIDLISALHEMMRSFVDRAFGDDPVQLAAQPRDNLNKNGAAESASVVKSSPATIDTCNHLTNGFGNQDRPEEKAIDR